MKDYYLVTTGHLEDKLWFLDDDDFRTGMNYVAIQASLSDVIVLCFILMSNHLHFVLYGEREEALAFVNGIKARYSQYYYKKYGVNEFLRRNRVDIQRIDASDESLERAVAYVLMNSVAANICSHPTQYPWGTGNLFFNSEKPSATPLHQLSKRARSKLFHSWCPELPLDWKVGKAGFILPECYVNVSFVESRFRTPQRMNYFLMSSSKARRHLESFEGGRPVFRDQAISAMLPDLCRSLFQKQRYEDLSTEEKIECLRQMRFRFCTNPNQIARVIGLSYEEVAKMLDST